MQPSRFIGAALVCNIRYSLAQGMENENTKEGIDLQIH